MEKTRNQNINKIMMDQVNIKQSFEEKIREIKEKIGQYGNYRYGFINSVGEYFIELEGGKIEKIDINEFIRGWEQYLKKEGFNNFFFVADRNGIELWILLENITSSINVVMDGKEYKAKIITIFEFEESDPEFIIYFPPQDQN